MGGSGRKGQFPSLQQLVPQRSRSKRLLSLLLKIENLRALLTLGPFIFSSFSFTLQEWKKLPECGAPHRKRRWRSGHRSIHYCHHCRRRSRRWRRHRSADPAGGDGGDDPREWERRNKTNDCGTTTAHHYLHHGIAEASFSYAPPRVINTLLFSLSFSLPPFLLLGPTILAPSRVSCALASSFHLAAAASAAAFSFVSSRNNKEHIKKQESSKTRLFRITFCLLFLMVFLGLHVSTGAVDLSVLLLSYLAMGFLAHLAESSSLTWLLFPSPPSEGREGVIGNKDPFPLWCCRLLLASRGLPMAVWGLLLLFLTPLATTPGAHQTTGGGAVREGG